MRAQALQQHIRRGIPLSAAVDFSVRELSDTRITVAAAGAVNVNVHGTAFAGSLYVVCVLAAWGLVRSRLPDNAALVIVQGRIQHHAPVRGDIHARAAVEPDAMGAFLRRFGQRGRARIEVSVSVPGDAAAAVAFTATLHAAAQ